MDNALSIQDSMTFHRLIVNGTVSYMTVHIFGEQGYLSGESARLPPVWPRLDSQTQCHKWVEFVGSLLCSERFFSGYSGFPLSPKTKI